MYRVTQKIWHNYFVRLNFTKTLTDFQNYFTTRIRRKFVVILSLKIPSHLKCVATLPCEMSSVLKATTENKTTSVTTYFKKLTTAKRVYCLSYCLKLLSHHAVFTSNVQCILLAAGPRTQAGDATDRAIDQWRCRLECIVQQQGGYTEHLM